MRLRKLLAMFLALSMLVSLVPTAAFATETGSEPSSEPKVPAVVNPNNLFLDKTATLTKDGTYTIDLEAYATGTPITTTIVEGKPLDVVLVIDQSGTLNSGDYGGSLAVLKSSVTSFVEELKANGEAFGVNHRIAVCGFASSAKQGNSGIMLDGYSYANSNHDNAWVNTGIFVNGEFMDYGTLEYIPVTDPAELNTKMYYSVECDLDGDGVTQFARVFYKNNVWGASSKEFRTLAQATLDEEGNVIATASENLIAQYTVYKAGKSTNLLSDTHYAASWENIADGVNGQGNINSDIIKTIDNLAANGATATFYGLKMASRMMENAPDDGIQRKKVVIVFTDGVPGYSGYTKGDADAALSESMKIKKDGTEVYTVGVYNSAVAATVETFMNQLSSNYVSHSFTAEPTTIDMDAGSSDNSNTFHKYSRDVNGDYYGITPYFYKVGDNYWPIAIFTEAPDLSVYSASYITDDAEEPIASSGWENLPDLVGDVYMMAEPVESDDPDANYYRYSSDIADLPDIFQDVVTDATTYIARVELSADTILKDVLADGFKLTDNTTVTVSVIPGSVSEENKGLAEEQLTSDKITWGEAQQVLTFAYPDATEGTGAVTVGEETIMTLTAQAGSDGVVTVSGFDYANQFIGYGHDGYKLVVSITGIEADANITTDAVLETNLGTSGIYESASGDADEDGTTGEIQAAFPIPTTYLSSKTYYLDYTGKMTIDPKDFLMTVKGVNADVDGYNYFGEPGTTIETEYGEVTVNEDGTITYTLTENNSKNPDTFYLFGTTENSTVTGATANANGNMWSKITIVPPADIRGNLFVDKTATLEDNGTYTIDLEAYATGTPVTIFSNEATTLPTETTLGVEAILKDVMADGFKLTDNTTITVSVVPGSVSEENKDLAAHELTKDKINWGTAQQVLTFAYPAATTGSGKVIVTGAVDQTQMTLTAKVDENGVITVTGYNYADPADNYKKNAQYISYGHAGSKLVVTITGVEAKNGVTTDSFTVTNKGASGIYEASGSDLDGDGTFGEMQAYFPIPTTYLSSKTYYVDYSGELIIDPADFLMTIKGYSLDKYGYHGFGAPGTIIEMDHGTVTVLDDGKLKFTMKSDGLGITDTFYLFGHTDNATVKAAMANTTGNMWSKVTIITPEDITGKLFLDKEATLTDDGTYTIDLNAYATGTPAITTITEGVPLDVVLLIDQSGSLMLSGIVDELQGAVSSFVNELKINGEAYGVSHRVSVATYASAGTDGATGFLGDGFPRSESPEEGTNILYPHWYNTGLFVNGKFKNYGTLEYIPVESVEAMGKQVRFLLDYDYEGDGIWERWVTDTASPWRFRTYKLKPTGFKNTPIKDANGKNITTNQALFDNYKLYTAGAATCTLTDDDYKEAWEYLTVGENGSGALNEDISRIISQIASSGGTRTSYGMKMAAQLIKNCPDDGIERKKIVIVFSDGAPGQNSYNEGDAQAALAEAKKIKNAGIEIYTVGVYPTSISANAETFMDRLSSNYSDHTFSEKTTTLSTSGYTFEATIGNAKMVMSKCFFKDEKGNYWPVAMSYPFDNTGMKRFYYVTDEGEVTLQNSKTTTYPGLYTLNHVKSDDPDANYFRYTADITKLEGMFKDIVKEATTVVTEARLDANMIMKDVLADGFKLTGNTTVTVSVVPGSVSTANSNIPADELTSDKITWGEPQQVLSFAYPTETEKSGSVVVNGAADRTEMTLNAKVTADGIITVDGFNYAGPTDPFCIDAQYIRAGHPGSKLVVTVTGVEAKTDVVTDSVTTTNKGTSGIYESENSDLDEDGEKGELQASFPLPTTYLSSKTYYLDYTGKITIDPADFLMTVKGVNADIDGYNFFDPAAPGTTVYTEYGKITVNADGTITYELVGADWEHDDIFYLFGTTEDPTVKGATANANGNMWSKIIIVPPEDIRGKLYVDKTATLEDNGTYTIDLEAFATGTPSSTIIKDGIPLDVVLVIDQSGSLFSGDGGGSLETLKSSVTSFIEALKTNGEAFGVNHRVSICGFASAAKQGASGVKYYGLSYANNIQDNAWINTGLFVNGQFKDYGTLEYIPVERVDDIVSSRYYAVEHDFDKDGIMEISRTYVRNGAWVVSSGTPSGTQYITLAGVTKDADGNVTATANENLFNNYKVYTVGDSSNLLTDPDYAASWENVADGLNGQGNINPDITKTIDSLAASGATATFYGLKMAARMLANVPDDGIERKRVVIVFTDGVPGYNGYTQGDGDAALSEVMKIKETDAEVYAVGIYKASSAASVETFMNQLSSNYVSHSFTTEPIQMDMAKAGTGSTFLKYTRNIDGSYYGISPYFHKVVNDDGTEDFWPISVYYDPTVDQNLYHAAYITDDAEIEIASGAKDAIPGLVGDVYMLAEPVVNEHPDADYYKYSSTIDDLSAIFKAITTDATTFASETALGVDAVLKDVMASNFVLTDNTTVTVSVVPGSVSEENKDLTANELTKDKITWGEAQQVLTFNYSEAKEGTGKVVVNGAADQTEMTLTAKVDENGVITVTGYNYADPADNNKNDAQYIAYGHAGSKLVVTVTGVEAKTDVVTDSVTTTNKGTSGIYESENSDLDEDGEKGELQASFPLPTTYMASKVYVVDYAKTMTINPSDFLMTVGAVSVDEDGYNHFNPAVTAITEAYGKVTVEDGKITYTPTKTNWNGFDTFYVFGTTENATIKAATANRNGNMWAKVSVVPANNVYYEDTFVTNESTGIAGIVFGGVWEEVDEAGNTNAGGNGQGENAESSESTTKDDQGNDHQGGVHGWEDNLADDTGYSDGSAHVSSKTGATATFTFTGTGVDIYSRTNDKTGMVIAMLYEGTSTTDENGKNLVAKYSLIVDNLAASGDYFQIPTLSFFQIPLKIDGKIQKDENGNTIMTDLPHGTYTVKIIVSKANDSQTGSERFLYYLDGIRVYNPIQNQEGDSTVSGAYSEKELNANFVEIRDKLLDANSFSAEIDKSAGPVFIDRITSEDGSHTDNTKTVEIGTYKVFGPKNEVYLSANQIVAFTVPYKEGAHYYIGMKSLTGNPAKVITNSTDENVNVIIVGHTTDQYYEVVPKWEYDEHGNPTTGVILVHADITNGNYVMDENGKYITDENGDYTYEGAILALTKLKVTGPEAKNFKFARVSNNKLLEMVAEDLAPSLDMDDTNSSPDVGGNTPNKPNVDINKPGSDTTVDEQTALKNLMIDLLSRIFSDLRGWFKS